MKAYCNNCGIKIGSGYFRFESLPDAYEFKEKDGTITHYCQECTDKKIKATNKKSDS